MLLSVVSLKNMHQPPSFVGKPTCVCTGGMPCIASLQASFKTSFDFYDTLHPFSAGREFELQR